MPNVPVKAEQVESVVDRKSSAAVTVVSFIHRFEKGGWTGAISFDCLIDANIDPVEVTKKV